MSFWQWMRTPAEPKWLYGLLVGVITFVCMILSAPLWTGGGIVASGLAGGLSGLTGGILAKLWMERRK